MRRYRIASLAILFLHAGLAGALADSPPEGPSAAAVPVLALVEDTLFSIPVGADPARNIAYEPDLEEECCDAPPAGIAAVSDDGNIYVFDYGNRHIKVLGKEALRIIPGPGLPDSPLTGQPIDMAVAHDVVYLLVDLRVRPEDGSDRFRIYRLTPPGTAWERIDFARDIKAGTGDVSVLGGIYITHENLARIYAAPEGTLYLYHRTWNTSYPLVCGARVFSESEQLALAVDGWVTSDGRVMGKDSSSEPPLDDLPPPMSRRGFLLGTDTRGLVYTMEHGPGYGSSLFVYDHGRLLAEGSLNMRERRLARLMAGAGDLLVAPSGGIYVFQPKEDQFVVGHLHTPATLE